MGNERRSVLRSRSDTGIGNWKGQIAIQVVEMGRPLREGREHNHHKNRPAARLMRIHQSKKLWTFSAVGKIPENMAVWVKKKLSTIPSGKTGISKYSHVIPGLSRPVHACNSRDL